MKALDLFCGAGGAGLGLERAGFEVLGLDNWNPAIQTHRKNGLAVLPRDLIAHPLAFGRRGGVDLLWASPPCQPFSVGGFGKGNADDRDGIPSTIVSIQYYQPNVFIIENVKGLTFPRHRQYLGGVISELEEIGYQVEWKSLKRWTRRPSPRHRLAFWLWWFTRLPPTLLSGLGGTGKAVPGGNILSWVMSLEIWEVSLRRVSMR